MKELINEVKGEITQYGYRKSGNSFWKVEDGFYKLINFQCGAYGEYFFINVGLHPVGLPSLITGKLEINERPREHQCIIRQRIGDIVLSEAFKKPLLPIHDTNIIQEIAAGIPKVEDWLTYWGSFDVIANKGFEELSRMMPLAPIIWKKAYYMLKCYCMLKQQNAFEAKRYLLAYLSENKNMDFSAVDRYLEELLVGCSPME